MTGGGRSHVAGMEPPISCPCRGRWLGEARDGWGAERSDAFGEAEPVQGWTAEGWTAQRSPMSAARTAPAAPPIRLAGFAVRSTFPPTGKETLTPPPAPSPRILTRFAPGSPSSSSAACRRRPRRRRRTRCACRGPHLLRPDPGRRRLGHQALRVGEGDCRRKATMMPLGPASTFSIVGAPAEQLDRPSPSTAGPPPAGARRSGRPSRHRRLDVPPWLSKAGQPTVKRFRRTLDGRRCSSRGSSPARRARCWGDHWSASGLLDALLE